MTSEVPLKSRPFFWSLLIAAAVAALIPARVARAQSTVQVPLTIDYVTLSQALERQLYTENGRASLWNGSNECQYLWAEHPRFSRAGERLELETDGSLSIGVPMGAQCLSPIAWSGIIEAETTPWVSGHMLKFRVEDLNLLNAQHQKTLIAGKGFDLVKQYFIPNFETFAFDLDPATSQLQALAQEAAPPEVAERTKAVLASLRVLPQVAALDDGIRATVELTLPAFPTASPAPPAAQLTPAELAAFQTQLDQWDAFLVFAIKQLGGVSSDQQTRNALFDLLLDSRHRLVEALANPQSGGPDPVRILFLDVWNRLGGIIRDAAHRGMLGNRSLEFLSFISAGDALFALDQAAPALGMRISADDLRRLAHIMAPRATGDPLAFSFDEDPELRRMFGIKQPLKSAGPLELGPSEAPTASATPSPAATASPTPSPPAAGPTSLLEFPRWPLGASTADAAEIAHASSAGDDGRLQMLARRLRRAVVDEANAEQYRAAMAQMLDLAGRRASEDEGPRWRYRALYARMVRAVPWQESCWRQFVRKRNRIVFLESSTADVGLMQVNRYVWRGFYSVPRLEWDVLYNASAGMDILVDLLDDVGDRRGAMPSGKLDELARSTYAAYNGGPSAYRRWHGRESREERQIDRSFWQKYHAVSLGRQIDILTCATQWEESH